MYLLFKIQITQSEKSLPTTYSKLMIFFLYLTLVCSVNKGYACDILLLECYS